MTFYNVGSAVLYTFPTDKGAFYNSEFAPFKVPLQICSKWANAWHIANLRAPCNEVVYSQPIDDKVNLRVKCLGRLSSCWLSTISPSVINVLILLFAFDNNIVSARSKSGVLQNWLVNWNLPTDWTQCNYIAFLFNYPNRLGTRVCADCHLRSDYVCTP